MILYQNKDVQQIANKFWKYDTMLNLNHSSPIIITMKFFKPCHWTQRNSLWSVHWGQESSVF